MIEAAEFPPVIKAPEAMARTIRDHHARVMGDLSSAATELARLLHVDITRYEYIVETGAFVLRAPPA